VIKLESSDPPGDVLFAATALFPKIKRGALSAPASILLVRRIASSIPTCPPRARRGEAHVVEHGAGVKELGSRSEGRGAYR
jgi:hypothetical protein